MQAFEGLSEAEAVRRLLEVGANELPRPPPRDIVRISIETLREPMFLLLLGAAGLYLSLGDVLEGAFLLAGACAAVGLVVFQEARSERALAALRDLAQPSARVIRGGVERVAPARDLVPGDVVLIGEGERMVADAMLIGGDVLSVDESTLTGESAPVAKRVARDEEAADVTPEPGSAASPYLFSGTLLVRGQGVARVTRTGAGSTLGRIGRSLADIAEGQTPLQKTAARLVGLLGVLAIGFCAAIALAYGLLRDDWIGGVLAGLTVAISLIPEEFPMVLAVFMALGAWRLATSRVLVRRNAVIETLGGASVLCVDKTGTLTENQMRVARLWTPQGGLEITQESTLPADAVDLLACARRASSLRPIDPMDRAIHAACAHAGCAPDDHELDRHWPLRPDRMAVVQLWRRPDRGWTAAAKGAPEAVFALCRLPPQQIQSLEAIVHDFAEQGLRVLGVARLDGEGAFADEPTMARFELLGLLGFLDPVRTDVPDALKEARAAGIAVMMITGDHPSTARAIARTAGVDVAGGVLLGADLAALPFPLLRERVRETRVFARITPEQKLIIVEALKANGEVVAMTGDGVNDAPALEAAHIGIAMGRIGTDVAREAADLVLLDDSFVSIVGGVRLGRRIFTNLRRALTYITAIHIPIAGLALAPVLMGLPPLLYPMHVVLLELAIDPLCSLVFESEPSEAAAMKRPPRKADEGLFGANQLALAAVQGVGVLVGVLGIYLWALSIGPEAQARGAAFVTLVAANLILALSDTMSAEGRLFAPHRRIYWLIVSLIATLMLLVFVIAPLRAMFGVAAPSTLLLAASLAVAVASGGWWTLWMWLRARMDRP
ncbi:MAG: cation-translocating P-type ATPase [Hyphomonadaceae bacterium]|nr:cation-translocating P-type ATPase [Hyphomonadaceae bacterium]